jgi:sec-independent protein translocase protein TatB
MLNLDPGKLLVIAVVAIILLGPDRLPQVARQVGGAWRSFNEFRHRMETEVRSSMPDLPATSEIARLARSPSALLNHLSSMSSNEEAPPEAADGTFQPPVPPDAAANGPVPADAAANGTMPADAAVIGPVPADADSGSGSGSEPGPTPIREDRGTGPPEVIVPGDPTLN